MKERVLINRLTKLTQQKGVGVGQMLTWLKKERGGVGKILTLADEGGRGSGPPHFWLTYL